TVTRDGKRNRATTLFERSKCWAGRSSAHLHAAPSGPEIPRFLELTRRPRRAHVMCFKNELDLLQEMWPDHALLGRVRPAIFYKCDESPGPKGQRAIRPNGHRMTPGVYLSPIVWSRPAMQHLH